MNKEELIKNMSFNHFFSYTTKKAVQILNDYYFMNPAFFDKDEKNSETGLTAEETWNLLSLKKNKLKNTVKIDLSLIYESELKKKNIKEFLLNELGINEKELEIFFAIFFAKKDENEKIKKEYGFDYEKFYKTYIQKENLNE